MANISIDSLLSRNVDILKSRISKTTYEGILIAISTVIFATLLASHYTKGGIGLEGIIEAQANNFALWVLDCIPFIFGFWGQYSNSIIANEASALIFELWNKADFLEKQVNYTATHDPVTDLPNRALFYERAERAIISASIRHKPLSVLLVEIENLKEIHDTLGRSSRSRVLKQVATRLKAVAFTPNNIARLDSNVFSLLLDEVETGKQPLEIAMTIHKALESPLIISNLKLSAHANIGIVLFPEHGKDIDTLIQRGGVALFIASQSNQGLAVYDPSYDLHSPKRLTLMSELRHAIRSNQLDLYYQAKVSASTGTLYGAEALVRWHHPKHGLFLPDEFIPLAERTRIIRPLTAWVLKRAFADCARWRDQGIELTLSVNLSAKDLHDPELPNLIAGIVAAVNIQPQWIMFEITESTIMHDPESAHDIIRRLHEMGFKFSIDDYGTGYSSLVYLKKLPLTELKIDRSFVKDILVNDNDAVIVKATINMAHNLGLQVTSEGVESEDVLARLNDYGCELAQGFLINPPLPFQEFTAWIANNKVAA